MLRAFLLFFAVCLIACETDYAPKPTAYPRVYYPSDTTPMLYDPETCPYAFSLPAYFRMEAKNSYFDQDISDACWVNAVCDTLNATIYFSYKTLDHEASLQKLMEEAYSLTYKHTDKVDYIQPREIDNGHETVGLIYYVGGDAASNIQFFVTDTAQHFVRGALYFYARPNADSLKPVVQFLVNDVEDMLSSWRWK